MGDVVSVTQYRDQAEGAQVRGEADSERRLDLSQAMKRR
jgi:hypothetical protein